MATGNYKTPSETVDGIMGDGGFTKEDAEKILEQGSKKKTWGEMREERDKKKKEDDLEMIMKGEMAKESIKASLAASKEGAKYAKEASKMAAKGAAEGAKLGAKASRYLLKKVFSAQKDAIDASVKVSKMGVKTFMAILFGGYLLRIICAPTSFPIGMIHKILPLSICLPKTETYEDSSESSEKSSELYTHDTKIQDKKLGENVNIHRIQQSTIRNVREILQKNTVETSINISANQRVNVKCPSTLLDQNPIMRRMAAVRPKDSDDEWITAKVDLTTCSGGEKLKFKDSDGNYQYDTCDPIDSSKLLFLNEKDKKDIPDKGGWTVEYDDGTIEENIREYDENGVRNIRWIFGCCPVADQVIKIKVSQIKGDMKKIVNSVKNEINKMNEESAEVLGCPVSEVKVNMESNQEADIQLRTQIQQIVEQKNRQTVIAAQNINYTDYFQTCHKGEARVLKQEINIDALSSNIVKSSVQTSYDNKITLKAKSETSITFHFESFTPRILVFSFILNMIILYISALVLIKMFKD